MAVLATSVAATVLGCVHPPELAWASAAPSLHLRVITVVHARGLLAGLEVRNLTDHTVRVRATTLDVEATVEIEGQAHPEPLEFGASHFHGSDESPDAVLRCGEAGGIVLQPGDRAKFVAQWEPGRFDHERPVLSVASASVYYVLCAADYAPNGRVGILTGIVDTPSGESP